MFVHTINVHCTKQAFRPAWRDGPGSRSVPRATVGRKTGPEFGSIIKSRMVDETPDPAVLSPWLAERVAGFHGPLTVERLQGGQSNPTFRLVTPESAYVLRRKPFGDLLPSAHAVERDAVATAVETLAERETALPPPSPIGGIARPKGFLAFVMVTVAPASRSSIAMGLPTIFERPITTALA